jgi:LmbE family N-acetylglucosaminyl deacetylase
MSFKSRLRPFVSAAAPWVEKFWRAPIRLIAPDALRPAARWSSSGGQSVLVVAPHPDDEAMGCAGVILRHVAASDRVRIAIATDGRRSKAITNADEMAAVRRLEATRAGGLMQIERLEWLGLPEGDWPMAALVTRLRSLLEQLRPDVVYAPSRVDFHPEHFAVAHALALAMTGVGATLRETRVRVYQVQVPLTCRLVNLVADVSDLLPRCEAIMKTYASQAFSVECGYRQRRYAAGVHRMGRAVEEFWELDAATYTSLHCDPPASWPQEFRGLRNLPLTDPLAYLAGARERSRIAKRLRKQSASSA